MSITLADIRMALPNFTKEELLELNSELCDIIKHKRASASHEAIQMFRRWRQGFLRRQGTPHRCYHQNQQDAYRHSTRPLSSQISGPAYMFTKCEPAFDPTTGVWE